METRIAEHKSKINPNSFSARYNLNKLVYIEFFETIDDAILREKQLKGGSRKAKESLIEKVNPEWCDLSLRIDEFIERKRRVRGQQDIDFERHF